MFSKAWNDFKGSTWKQGLDVRDFIVTNYTPYDGNEAFLKGPSRSTRKLWSDCKALLRQEHLKGGVLDINTETVSGIVAFPPAYLNRDLEVVVGLQTDKPLKRAIVPYGGVRMAAQACSRYNHELSGSITNIFTRYRKTHNEGVFSAYTPEMKKARKCGVMTGLPDAYGRGRIIGDYRRVALYGVNRLVEEKLRDLESLAVKPMSEEVIRLREEVWEQITALKELVELGAGYGFDLSAPAQDAVEAVQWTYLAFLGAVRETNGAANSFGRVSSFLDIYITRDLEKGKLDEDGAQELIDQLVLKLRLLRHLRTPEYNELFAGDPMWITEALGGMCLDGRHMVTRTCFRMLQTLFNLGPSPEPNLTILWSPSLPAGFRLFCARVSMVTSAIQYENDELMRPVYGDDYSISCCVSAMPTGKSMQYFGARCNLPKLLLLALNGGRDEITGDQIAPPTPGYEGEYLDYDKVLALYKNQQKWLTELYVNTLNIIHHMHDKYAYERLMMALHDTSVNRVMAFGIAGLSVVADSLSAIRYAKVRVIRDERGLITDFEINGDYPRYGNDDDRVDSLAVVLVQDFYRSLCSVPTYRGAAHTISILTITSNVVYGKKTGNTPDGRKKGEAFAPGANPMHGRDVSGVLAALNTVAKIPYDCCRDGVSMTLNVIPRALGRELPCRLTNLAAMIDGYFARKGHHLNINVLERVVLEKAMEDPVNYPQLTIRVSGYAVNFIRLTRDQQLEVLARTFHSSL